MSDEMYNEAIDNLQSKIFELAAEVERLKEIEQTNDTLLDQLGDKNAALLDEVARLKTECANIKEVEFPKKVEAVANGWRTKLAIAEEHNARLQNTLDMWLHATVNDRTEYAGARAITRKELSLPASREALDKYVAEKVKDLQDLVAIEEANGKHWANAYSKWVNSDKSARLLIEQGDEIAKLTKQRDLVVEALQWIASSLPQIGVERVWMLDHANKTLVAIKESEV